MHYRRLSKRYISRFGHFQLNSLPLFFPSGQAQRRTGMNVEEVCSEAPAFSKAEFREAMGTFATGVAVVLANHDGHLHGMTVNSLTSVSLEPPLLLVCPRRGSTTGRAMMDSGAFVMNILDVQQRDIATRFVGDFANRFDGLDLGRSTRGFPVLAKALAHFDCVVRNVYEGGDHDIVVGEVVSCTQRSGSPLLFYGGRFGSAVID
jgi:flavin reductase (DIM6/NTAB) family NADH-FMN oxidoreductase RutF